MEVVAHPMSFLLTMFKIRAYSVCFLHVSLKPWMLHANPVSSAFSMTAEIFAQQVYAQVLARKRAENIAMAPNCMPVVSELRMILGCVGNIYFTS